jgi:glycosyltransferase involved in cell wall biosynthesis
VVEPRHSHAFVEGLTRHYVSHYTCVSAAVAGFARKTLRVPGEQISVIPNGVHVPAVVPGARDLGSLHGVTVGRVTRQKGIDTMLAALAALPAGMVWDWAFVGEHPEASYSEAMREMAAKLGLAGRVRWVGPVPRSAMDRIYRESNLLALPSRWEGQPNAILEAFAYDLPVVATDVDGTRDFEDEAPGAIELVSPESPTALAAAVLRLSSDGALRQRRQAAGRSLVCARNWPCICDRYDELYQRVIEQWRHDPARHPGGADAGLASEPGRVAPIVSRLS